MKIKLIKHGFVGGNTTVEWAFDPAGLDDLDHWALKRCIHNTNEPTTNWDNHWQYAFAELAERLGHEVEFDYNTWTPDKEFYEVRDRMNRVKLDWTDLRYGVPVWTPKSEQ